jgi:hypothetical protein
MLGGQTHLRRLHTRKEMGIWSILLDENSEEFGEWFSKPVNSFLSALEIYCTRALLDRDSRVDYTEVLKWFPPITEKMNKPLCLLYQAYLEPWEYEENEYQKYLAANQSGPFPPMTQEQFLNTCYLMQDVDPWLTPRKMQEIVRALVKTLSILKPEDTWWYDANDTIPDLKDLLNELENAKRLGIKKVRFGYG